MIQLLRTDSNDPDYIHLIRFLDAYLAEKDGEEHAFYAQFNKSNRIKHVVVAYEGENAVGCGAIKEWSPNTMEVKRMYTMPEARGKGVASLVLVGLEKWALELGYAKCVLETGKRQTEAVRLYTKQGYLQIENYGQYAGVENSVCFEKYLGQ